MSEAIEYLVQEEEQKLIDMDQVTRIALERVERSGIIFLDEIDKSRAAKSGTDPMSAAKVCSAISCPSSKAPRSTRATASCGPITFCSSRRARSTSPSPAT